MDSTTINVVTGDSGYNLSFTLQNSDGTAFNLTGATVTIKMQLVGYDTVTTGTLTVVSAPAGTCTYTVASTDFPADGNYNVQIDCAFTGGALVTFYNITVVAAARVPF